MRTSGRRAVIQVTLLALLTPASVHAQSAESPSPAPAEEIAELHRLVNEHRARIGCTALRWHEPTARVALGHSRDMAQRDYFDHVSPDGTDPGERLLSAGVTWRGSMAENIARTPAGASSAVEMWLDSPPHRENIELCDFTHHGVGRFGDWWTQVLVERPGPTD